MTGRTFKHLIDGDHERFGPTRAQVNVWAAGQDKVELTFDREFILEPADCDDLAHWLTAVLKPSIENINASVEGVFCDHESAIRDGRCTVCDAEWPETDDD